MYLSPKQIFFVFPVDIYLQSLNRRFIILFTLVTLFSVVMENYKSYFSNSADIELVEKKDTEGKDSGKSAETEDLDSKENYFAIDNLPAISIITLSRFYIVHSSLFPAPCTSQMEMPPEQA